MIFVINKILGSGLLMKKLIKMDRKIKKVDGVNYSATNITIVVEWFEIINLKSKKIFDDIFFIFIQIIYF